MNPAQALASFYERCEPDIALPVDDERHVDLAAARGVNWQMRLTAALRRPGAPSWQILSGFQGDGKTTELRRLAAELRTGAPRFAVVYVRAADYVHAYHYSIVDVLNGIISETGRVMRQDYGLCLRPSYFKQRWTELKGLLFSKVELQQLKLEARADPFAIGAQIGLKARSSAEVSDKLWSALAPGRATLAKEFAVLVEKKIRPALRARQIEDLVVLVDDLEKLRPDRETNGYTKLFIDEAPVLKDLGVAGVLTVPVALAYSSDGGRLRNAFGTFPHVVPSARVPPFCAASCGSDERERAIAALREVVARRLPPELRGGLDVAFDEIGTLDDLIRFSGGHVRTLLSLVRLTLEALSALPITAEALADTRKLWGQAISREVRSDAQLRVASHVAEHHRLPRDPGDEVVAMDLLQSLHVLAYHNEREFYDVLPAVRGLL